MLHTHLPGSQHYLKLHGHGCTTVDNLAVHLNQNDPGTTGKPKEDRRGGEGRGGTDLQSPVQVLAGVTGRDADARPGRQQGCCGEAHNGHGNVLLKQEA